MKLVFEFDTVECADNFRCYARDKWNGQRSHPDLSTLVVIYEDGTKTVVLDNVQADTNTSYWFGLAEGFKTAYRPLTEPDLESDERIYEVWSEGYQITGGGCPAYLVGSTMARSFQEACDIVCYIDDDPAFAYDMEKRTLWGCRLFPTEQEAQVSFG